MKKIILLFLSVVSILGIVAQRPKVGLPSGLSGELKFVNFNQKGSKLVSVTSDNTVKVWDAQSGKGLTELKLDLFPDYAIFTADDNKIIMACNVAGPKNLEQKMDALTISTNDKRKPEAGYIVTWTLFPVVKVDSFRVADYKNAKYMEMDPKEEQLLLMSENGKTISIFNRQTNKLIFSLKSDDAGTAVKSIPDQIQDGMKSGGLDLGQLLNMASNPNAMKTMMQGKGYRSAHFSPDGKKIITGGVNSPAIVWNIANTAKLIEIKTGLPSVLAALFDKTGKKIITGSFDEEAKKVKVEVWNAETGKLQDSLLNINDRKPSIAVNSHTNELDISADWKFISDYNGLGELVSVTGSKQKQKFSSQPNEINYGTIVFNTNSKLIAWYNSNGAYVTDFYSSRRVSDMRGAVTLVNNIQLSPDGKRMLTSFSPDESILKGGMPVLFSSPRKTRNEVRDLATGKVLFTVKPGKGFFNAAGEVVLNDGSETSIYNEAGQLSYNNEGYYRTWSSDGNRAVSIMNYSRNMTMWNMKEKKKLFDAELPGDNVNVRFCSNDEKLVGTETGTSMRNQHVFILNSSDGKEIKRFDSTSANVLLSPEKNKVLITRKGKLSKNPQLIIYDISKDKTILCAPEVPLTTGGNQYLPKGAFSPDSKKFVVGNKEKVFLFDAVTGMQLAELVIKKDKAARSGGYDYEYMEAEFSPDSRFVKISARAIGSDRPVNKTDNFIVFDAENGRQLMVKEGIEGLINASSFTQKSKLLVMGEFGEASALYDLPSGKRLFSLEDTEQRPLSSTFSKDGRTIYSSFSDGAIKIHQADNGKLLTALYLFDSTACLAMLPSGYYYTTDPGTNSIYYVTKDLKIISFEQLDLKYNRPDLVLQSMGNTNTPLIDAYRKTYYNRLERNGIDSTLMTRELSTPEADFTDRDQLQYKEFNGKVELHIKAVDNNNSINRFNIWVNEVPLFGRQGLPVFRRKNDVFDTTITVKLSANSNKLETSVTNTNAIESYRAPLYVVNTAQPERPKVFFIGIAVDNYAMPAYNNLKYTVNDVRSVSLKLKEKYGDNIVIDTLLNSSFTVERLRSVKAILEKTAINDKVILMYSGHGILDNEGHYYFPTSGMTKEDFRQAIPYDMLEDLLNNIPARNKLMLLDACHSGIYDKNAETVLNDSKTTTQIMDELFSYVGRGTGATIISSSSGQDLSLESDEWKHGFFTKSILDAMDGYHRGAFRVSTLKKSILDNVPVLSKGLQVPGIRSENKAADFEL